MEISQGPQELIRLIWFTLAALQLLRYSYDISTASSAHARQ